MKNIVKKKPENETYETVALADAVFRINSR